MRNLPYPAILIVSLYIVGYVDVGIFQRQLENTNAAEKKSNGFFASPPTVYFEEMNSGCLENMRR